MTLQPGLCQTWSKSQIVVFLMHRLNFNFLVQVRDTIMSHVMRNRFFVNAKIKTQISFDANAKLISAFVLRHADSTNPPHSIF